ncbi:MAG: tRNA pseudouridine(55) synthase TruB [Alphaproteobacteria bacterium]|nr:tRNA pseudouridine(55) synthase TruB [Alphaproteobacteria bacterium]
MGRRRKRGIKIDGWINLHKPLGVTSTQAVGKVRRALNAQKVGHGGTLDPLASGVLPIALGEATKTVQFAQDAIKTYIFEVTWGEQRSTDDGEGEIIQKSDERPSKEAIEAILDNYTGDIEQTPPQFSAIKIDGERAYDIARDGDVANIKSREVYIESLTITAHTDGKTTFKCVCGKGTYIRSLARDMGLELGCFGYISKLERTRVGVFELKDAISLDFFQELIDNTTQETQTSAVDEGVVLPLQTVLDDIPVLALKDQEATRLKNGQQLSFIAKSDMERLNAANIDWRHEDGDIALATCNDHPIAMVEVNGAIIRSLRVFNV